MKTSGIVWLMVVLVFVAGGWYFFTQNAVPASTGPSTALGINGSPNQGNLGGAESGTVQQPGDGSDISQNITLGTDGNAKLGTYLIGYTGMTVYTFSADTAGVSNCSDVCAKNWPPYTVPAGMQLNIKSGVSSDAVSTIVRTDGTTQLTYHGMPLYFYAGDTSSSDTKGQGIGGKWSVVTL